MSKKVDDTPSSLNGIIQTLKDGEHGFRASAEHLQDFSTASDFRNFAGQCAQFANELNAQMSRIGGTAEPHGTLPGSMSRAWAGLKSAGHDARAILEEAERSAEIMVKNYRVALKGEMPADLRSLLDRQSREIQSTHEAVRSLRDTWAKAKTHAGGHGA